MPDNWSDDPLELPLLGIADPELQDRVVKGIKALEKLNVHVVRPDGSEITAKDIESDVQRTIYVQSGDRLIAVSIHQMIILMYLNHEGGYGYRREMYYRIWNVERDKRNREPIKGVYRKSLTVSLKRLREQGLILEYEGERGVYFITILGNEVYRAIEAYIAEEVRRVFG